jgi:GTP diphosphokinase / guanosine-3',5'-bis(diphosphate) 3'-diphosphatase
VTSEEIKLDDIALRLGRKDGQAVLEGLGAQTIEVSDVIREAFPAKAQEFLRSVNAMRLSESTANQLIDIRDMPSGMALELCKDCSPVLGDRIVGVQRRGEPVCVHAIDCNRLGDDDVATARWLDLTWSGMPPGGIMATGRVKVVATNRPGVLAQLCQAIADNGANITGVRTGERSIDFTELMFDIEVADLKHLTMILSSLRAFSFVDRVERIRT